MPVTLNKETERYLEEQRAKETEWDAVHSRLSRMRARQQQAYELAEFGGDHDDEC